MIASCILCLACGFVLGAIFGFKQAVLALIKLEKDGDVRFLEDGPRGIKARR